MSEPIKTSAIQAAMAKSFFFMAVFDQAFTEQKSFVVHGWNDLCDEFVLAFYGKAAPPAQRATAMRFLTNWDDWTMATDGLPFNAIIQGDDGRAVELFRILDERHLPKATPQ